jgi:hypothetical protein
MRWSQHIVKSRARVFLSGSPAMNVYTFKRKGTLIEKEKKRLRIIKLKGKKYLSFKRPLMASLDSLLDKTKDLV